MTLLLKPCPCCDCGNNLDPCEKCDCRPEKPNRQTADGKERPRRPVSVFNPSLRDERALKNPNVIAL